MRIAIEGNIGAGKSSVLQHLAERLGCPTFPEPVDDWTDLLQLFYDSPVQYAFAFGLKVLLSFRAPLRSPSRCLVERSPLACRHVFSQLAYNDGNMCQAEWDLFKEFYAELGWTPDAIVFVHVPAETCADRIRQRGRECEARIDLAYLKKVEFQYATLQKYCEVPFIRIDGSRPVEDVVEDVLRQLRDLGFFDRDRDPQRS